MSEEMKKAIFPGKEWAELFQEEINKSQAYEKAAKNWEGDFVFVIKAEPEKRVKEDWAVWLDLWHGKCRDMAEVNPGERREAEYVIIGSYSRWKQIILKEMEPVKAMMQGKLKLKGSLPKIVRNLGAAKELVNCATRVPTVFMDEL